MKKLNYVIALFLIAGIWGGLSVFAWVKPADEFSMSERRKLADLPEFTTESVLTGKYLGEFEKYSLDQFPFRDSFRTLKSVSEFYLFQKSDNNDIYISDGYAAKIEYPLNVASIQDAAEKINHLYELYGAEGSGKVYLSIVPDKGYYLADKTGHPAMDYEALFSTMKEAMPYATYIDVASSLKLSDYYRTDTHWKQEKLPEIAGVFAKTMGINVSGKYKETIVEKPFYGVYYGQSALPLKNDMITYLSNEVLEDCIVYNEETKEITGLYNLDKLESRDMYEVYLFGASPLITIENPHMEEKKELVVFRDSFASSLVPLLAEGYSKITLVDTRYMQPSMIGDYVSFEGADILFLYSTSVLNNSQTLRK